jgi:hypothetical protein
LRQGSLVSELLRVLIAAFPSPEIGNIRLTELVTPGPYWKAGYGRANEMTFSGAKA